MSHGKSDFDLDLLKVKWRSLKQVAETQPEKREELRTKLEHICSHLYALREELATSISEMTPEDRSQERQKEKMVQ